MDTVWKIIAISMISAGLLAGAREIYTERGGFILMLKIVIKTPMAEPFGTWLVAYMLSILIGCIAYHMGFGFTPFCWMLGILTGISIMCLTYLVLKNFYLEGLHEFIKGLFSKLTLKIIICFGSGALFMYGTMWAHNHVDAYMPTFISYPLKIILYIATIFFGYFPFLISYRYDEIAGRFGLRPDE